MFNTECSYRDESDSGWNNSYGVFSDNNSNSDVKQGHDATLSFSFTEVSSHGSGGSEELG